MYKEITELNNRKKQLDINHHELQIWTADMWCLLWNAWLKGYNTNVIKEMDFSWATDPIEKYDTLSIYHNAGVVGNEPTKVFYKGLYTNKLPYNDNLSDVDETKCSKNYTNLIIEVSKNSCLI